MLEHACACSHICILAFTMLHALIENMKRIKLLEHSCICACCQAWSLAFTMPHVPIDMMQEWCCLTTHAHVHAANCCPWFSTCRMFHWHDAGMMLLDKSCTCACSQTHPWLSPCCMPRLTWLRNDVAVEFSVLVFVQDGLEATKTGQFNSAQHGIRENTVSFDYLLDMPISWLSIEKVCH